MPSATDKLQNKIIEVYGDLDSFGPEALLLSRGFNIEKGLISKVGVTEIWEFAQDELIAIMFLVEEWDYAFE